MHQRARKNRRTGVWYSYTLTYALAIILASVIMGLMMLSYALREIQTAQISAARRTAELYVGEMEKQQSLLTAISSRIGISYNFQRLVQNANVPNELSLLGDLPNYRFIAPQDCRFFVLIDGGSSIYTSDGKKSALGLYLESQTGCDRERAEALVETAKQADAYGLLPLNERYLLAINPIKTAVPHKGAYVCFLLPKDAWLRHFAEISGMTQQAIRVYWKETMLLGDAALAGEEPELWLDPLSTDAASIARKSGNRYQIIARSGNREYALYMSEDMISLWDAVKNCGQAGTIAIAALLLLLIAMGFAYVGYRPIRRLNSGIGGSSDGSKNEIVQIEEAFIRLEEERSVLSRSLRNQLLLSVLDGEYAPEKMERWRALDLQFDYKYYIVAILALPETSGKEIEAVERWIEGLSCEQRRFYAAHRGGQIEAIAAFNDLAQTEAVTNAMESAEMQDAQTAVGFAVDSPCRIQLSRIDALNKLQKQRRASRFSCGEEILLESFREALKPGMEETRVDSLMKQVLDCIRKGRLSYQSQQHLFGGIFVEILKAAELNALTIDTNYMLALMAVRDYEVRVQELSDVVRETFSVVKAQEEPSELVKYLLSHARDADMSVDRLAAQFHYSPASITQMIKKEVGVPYKEFVTSLRIKWAARELVQSPDKTVLQISAECGYSKSSNFIRVFKEATGLTPLKYREQNAGRRKENDAIGQ